MRGRNCHQSFSGTPYKYLGKYSQAKDLLHASDTQPLESGKWWPQESTAAK
jgi:hypothetical protein